MEKARLVRQRKKGGMDTDIVECFTMSHDSNAGHSMLALRSNAVDGTGRIITIARRSKTFTAYKSCTMSARGSNALDMGLIGLNGKVYTY